MKLETLLREVYKILAERYGVDVKTVELIIYDFTHLVNLDIPFKNLQGEPFMVSGAEPCRR